MNKNAKINELKAKVKEINDLCYDILKENENENISIEVQHNHLYISDASEKSNKEDFKFLFLSVINHY